MAGLKKYFDQIFPKVARVLQLINEQRHLQAVRTAFITIMPVMIASAFAVAINNLPFPVYQDWMLERLGPNWRLFGGLVFDGCMSVMTLIAVFSISSNLAKWHKQNRQTDIHEGICSMMGISCFFIMALPVGEAAGLSFAVTNVTGLFVGIVVSLTSCELFIALIQRKKERILSEDPNPAVPMAFRSITPVLSVLALFSSIRAAMVMAGIEESLTQLVYHVLSSPFNVTEPNLATAQIFNVSTHLFWTFGMHGNNVMEEVAVNIFTNASLENIAAFKAGLPPPHIYTKTMMDVFVYMGGSGATLCLLIALMIFGRTSAYRQLMRYALPTSIFNINEPLIFGIPIVLNPMFCLPFILTPVLTLFITAFAMKIGWVPCTVNDVSWTTPLFLSGYIATGSIAGSILQGVNLIAGVAVYTPFVRLNEAVQRWRFNNAYQKLCETIQGYGEDSRHLTQRTDETGAVARALANNLLSAIANNELYLVYQPIVDSRTNETTSAESLLRWKHPQRGIIHPMLTVALAEEINIIDEIGLWVLEKSVAQLAAWRNEGFILPTVSVNVSAHQLLNPRFAQQALQIVENYGVEPASIQLEITETLALAEDNTTIENLRALYSYGMLIAIDDFGMGHSSLVYLRSQPISTLKVDGSLSRDILTQPANLEIISSIKDLCSMLDVKMVIEFVEKREQIKMLQAIDAYFIQGYYYSPPVLPEKIPALAGEIAARDIC